MEEPGINIQEFLGILSWVRFKIRGMSYPSLSFFHMMNGGFGREGRDLQGRIA